jgi:hypothetical protein
MSNRVPYNSQSATGKTVARTVNQMLDSLAAMRRLNAQLNSASYGDDWASLSVELGGGVTPEQAHTLWTIIATATATLDVAQVAALADLDQG